MSPVRFDHVGFTVSDLERSVAWYSHLLGCDPVAECKGWDAPYTGEMLGYPGCEIDWAYFAMPGGGQLELVHYVTPPQGFVDMETSNVGNGHLSLVVEDIHAEFERLRESAAFRSPAPVEIPVGPNAGGWGCYLRDPDGLTVQLMQPPPAPQ